MLEIKHLKTLQLLAQTHSVNATAEALCMTQSALSHQIKQLEQQIGSPLFERKTKPIVFTPAGRLILQSAKEILPKLQYAERQLQAMQQGEVGRLLIGVDCHTCFDWLLPLVRHYQEKWSGVDLDILNSHQSSPLQELEQQQLDLVITSDPIQNPHLRFIPLFSYELIAILPPKHRLSERAFLTAADFADETLITYPVDLKKLDLFKQVLLPVDIQPRQIRHSELTLMILQNVSLGRGVCVLPRWLFNNMSEFSHLTAKSIGEQGLWTKLYAAVLRENADKAYIQDFIDLVADEMVL
ncbi:LysR family transcriptional regulator [Thiomicrorhabdus sp.]|uniref:LysR family transcriptional regulator n=1 Tax=Thiomicrorhabdus sp. TaxID=2039724 RepID=UPI0029C9A8DF|nr:LysR family transcriptional regulator [Thiomicrorhabdus sp.]